MQSLKRQLEDIREDLTRSDHRRQVLEGMQRLKRHPHFLPRIQAVAERFFDADGLIPADQLPADVIEEVLAIEKAMQDEEVI